MKRFRNTGSNFLTWVIIVTLVAMAYNVLSDIGVASNKLAFSEFLTQVDEGNVTKVVMRGDSIEGKMQDGSRFSTMVPIFYPELTDKLLSNNVTMEILPVETSLGSFFGILLSWFPILLLIGVWVYFMRNMQGSGNKAMGFGKSKAKMISEHTKVTFNDVAGIDEAKEELSELVDFLKNPMKFQKLGGKIPRGCLLVGSPGTGKTLLAKAIAGEAKVPFFSISGSDFVEMFVGVGASRVRDMFEQAKKHSPCIVFIDEIDAVGRHRGAGLGGGNDEREQTLNQLLVEMDGFAGNEGIIVIAATNRPDVLDPALLRPGRFDRQIAVPIPDINGREKILNVHMKNAPVGPDVNLRTIARGTPGFSGADLANVVNEAALMAARKNRTVITMYELEEAKDKIIMGTERRSIVMKEEQKKLTAYHEGGHALVGIHLPASDPIHKATIMPRGRALGLVMRLPEDDRFSQTREQLKADLAVAMGGRVAEETIFGYDKVTSGASGDIKAATDIARRMVTQWGLSDVIGPVLVGGEKEEVFLGHSLGKDSQLSEEITRKIDTEIRKFIDEAYHTAKKIITENMEQLHLLASSLLEYETLTGDEIERLLSGQTIIREDDNDSSGDTIRRKSSIKGSIEPIAGNEPKQA